MRRDSFCTSDMRSSLEALDDFFNIKRIGLSPEEKHSLVRASSSPASLRMWVLTQVDGPSGQRKTKTKKKNKTKKNKQKKKEKAQTVGKELPEGQGESSAIVDTAKQRPPVDAPQTPSTLTVRPLSRQSQGDQEQTQANLLLDEDNHTICFVHCRMRCQFYHSCCVHKGLIGCDCPPKWSCCCDHHLGDCCGAIQSAEQPGGGVPGVDTVMEDTEAAPERQNAAAITNDSSDSLSAHMLRCLEEGKFSDVQIVLKSSTEIFSPIIFHTHRMVISRSPLLGTLLKSPLYKQGQPEIVAMASENFCMIKGFEYALQELYGMPRLTAEQLRSITLSTLGYSEENMGQIQFSLSTVMADLALSYAAAGAFFQVEPIIETGIRLAVGLIDWGTVECILYFGVCVAKYAIVLDYTAAPSSVADGEATETNNSHDPVQELQKRAPLLVSAALEFIAGHMKNGFTLYAKAQSKSLPDRIPEYLRSVPGSMLDNPQLVAVKFGSLASTQEQKPGPQIEIPSAILISLPYEQLKELLKAMEARHVLVKELAQAVITEREARRLQALRGVARLGARNEQNVPAEIQELGYKETLTWEDVAQSPVSTLSREWDGLFVVEKKAVEQKVDGQATKHKK
ncbi:hypothetical protein BBP40_012571 [Aspergillus hancockii]|nr:hypothetical protein BBP40_012571 [Aspergillus hancockii]